MNKLEIMSKIVALLEGVKDNSLKMSHTDHLVISRMLSDANYMVKKFTMIPEEKTSIFEKQKQQGGYKKDKSMEELLSSYYDTVHENNN